MEAPGPIRTSHDTHTAPFPTDTTRTAAAAAMKSFPGFIAFPALCAPAHYCSLPLLTASYAMASAGAGNPAKASAPGGAVPLPTAKAAATSAPPAQRVAETPDHYAGRARDQPAPRRRDESRDRRDGPRGRSAARRREGSYDPRGASCSTNRSRSKSAFRDRYTDALIEDRLYSLSMRLVTLCRHKGHEAGQHPTRTGWFNLKGMLGHINTFPFRQERGQRER